MDGEVPPPETDAAAKVAQAASSGSLCDVESEERGGSVLATPEEQSGFGASMSGGNGDQGWAGIVEEGVYTVELVSGTYAKIVRGKVEYDDGSYYQGQIRKGQRDGKGHMVYSTCDEYVGEWKAGKRHGHGTLTQHHGGTYVGDWADDVFHGFGTEVFEDKAKYEGQYFNGMLHGHGKMTYPNGNVYEGAFHQNYKHGKGTIHYEATQDVFEGMFEQGKRHGLSTLAYKSTGKLYECDWKRDVAGPLRCLGDVVADGVS